MGVAEDVKKDKIERKFKKLLSDTGMLAPNITYDRSIQCFVVIKVFEDDLEIVKKFKELQETVDFRTACRQYEGKGDIWIFKAYLK